MLLGDSDDENKEGRSRLSCRVCTAGYSDGGGGVGIQGSREGASTLRERGHAAPQTLSSGRLRAGPHRLFPSQSYP